MRLTPIKITVPTPIEVRVSEDEILADLLYPASRDPGSGAGQ